AEHHRVPALAQETKGAREGRIRPAAFREGVRAGRACLRLGRHTTMLALAASEIEAPCARPRPESKACLDRERSRWVVRRPPHLGGGRPGFRPEARAAGSVRTRPPGRRRAGPPAGGTC